MDSAGLKQKLVNPRKGGHSSKGFYVFGPKKSKFFVDLVVNTVLFQIFCHLFTDVDILRRKSTRFG